MEQMDKKERVSVKQLVEYIKTNTTEKDPWINLAVRMLPEITDCKINAHKRIFYLLRRQNEIVYAKDFSRPGVNRPYRYRVLRDGERYQDVVDFSIKEFPYLTVKEVEYVQQHSDFDSYYKLYETLQLLNWLVFVGARRVYVDYFNISRENIGESPEEIERNAELYIQFLNRINVIQINDKQQVFVQFDSSISKNEFVDNTGNYAATVKTEMNRTTVLSESIMLSQVREIIGEINEVKHTIESLNKLNETVIPELTSYFDEKKESLGLSNVTNKLIQENVELKGIIESKDKTIHHYKLRLNAAEKHLGALEEKVSEETSSMVREISNFLSAFSSIPTHKITEKDKTILQSNIISCIGSMIDSINK